MPQLPRVDDASFDSFCELVSADGFVESVARRSDWNVAVLRSRLSLALGEAGQTLRLLSGLDVPTDGRMLEIGAGLGLAAAYLSSRGFDVVALEPAGVGFDEHSTLIREIASALETRHEVLTIGAEHLNRVSHGQFELIFSNNVLEHVLDLEAVVRSLAGVLAQDGVMLHSCPNYSVPFEPHFGIPLVPGRPALTRHVLPASIAETDLWRSLNFVRARDIAQVVTELGLSLQFREGALSASVARLGTDLEFRARHPLLGRTSDGLQRVGLTRLLRHLPPSWSTPMDFAIGPADQKLKDWASANTAAA